MHISFSYKLSYDEFRRIYLKTTVGSLLPIVIIFAIIAVCATLLTLVFNMPRYGILSIACWIVVIGYYPLTHYWTRSVVRKHPELLERIEWSFNESELVCRSDTGIEIHIPYSKVSRIEVYREYMRIVHQSGAKDWIPFRFVPEGAFERIKQMHSQSIRPTD